MRSHAPLCRLLMLAIAAAGIACHGSTEPLTENAVVGTYVLTSIRGVPVPNDLLGPGRGWVDSARLELEQSHRLVYMWHGAICIPLATCTIHHDTAVGTWTLLPDHRLKREFPPYGIDTLYVEDRGSALYDVFYVDDRRLPSMRFTRVR